RLTATEKPGPDTNSTPVPSGTNVADRLDSSDGSVTAMPNEVRKMGTAASAPSLVTNRTLPAASKTMSVGCSRSLLEKIPPPLKPCGGAFEQLEHAVAVVDAAQISQPVAVEVAARRGHRTTSAGGNLDRAARIVDVGDDGDVTGPGIDGDQTDS